VPNIKRNPLTEMLKGFLRYIQGPVFFKADEIEILKGEKLKDQRPKA